MSKQEKYDFNKIPFDDIVRLGQRSLLYTDLFAVSWLLGRFCNYHCSYCWRHGRGDKPDHRPTELIIETLDEIKKQARERGFNSFHFSFSGGEPTLHPGYLDILQHYTRDGANTNYQSLHMTTNMSLPLDFFKKYVEITKDNHRVSITASWHPEFAQKEPFAEKLLYCMENDIQITINCVMVPEHFDERWQDAMFFNEQGLNVTLKPQSDPTASFVVEGYTKEMLEQMRKGLPQRDYTKNKLREEGKKSQRPKRKYPYFDALTKAEKDDKEISGTMQVELMDKNNKRWYMDQAERFNAFGFNKFSGWECSSGYRSIIIREPDGSIKRSYSCHDEPLGFLGKGFKLFDSPQFCSTPSCMSSADSKIPKRQAGTKLPLWPGDETYKEKK